MGSAMRKIDEVKREWSERQRELQALGLNNKQAQKLNKDNRKLADLAILRQQGGPFVTPEEIDAYMASNIPVEEKQKRLRTEVRYARDSALSFPRNHPVFRIMDTSTKPYKLLSPQKFAENLKTFLNKCTGKTYITLDEFRAAIQSFQN